MKQTFAEHVIDFNSHLQYTGTLPPGIRIMNPFREQPQVMDIMQQFYRKYYGDHHRRRMIMGINPGRLGSGATGIPFTDTKRLTEVLGIGINGIKTHEPSSVFVYDVISAYGGPVAFYKDFYFASVSPLGFTSVKADGSEINYNYYDSKALTNAVYDFMVSSIRQQLEFGIDTDVCYCFGTGKNAAFLQQLNAKEQFFKTIVPLEHPRFIMQYRQKRKEEFITKYLEAFAAYSK
ncbi:protein of unknown function [Chitinophaga sp. YR627]|uniref:SMUG2 DNA glycosylase family protein n=1 Tax=Chitinophaga sp. YR627 TaxID=1881041 RepID=UPI0008EB0611|nr:SMUG2 DNA glycosylase family protein [Chitinophaga sp. YR627]SFO53037.1 protein of unknown function [Chitinophaga sp. YR627]